MFAYRFRMTGGFHAGTTDEGLVRLSANPDFMEATRLWKQLRWDGKFVIASNALYYLVGPVPIPAMPRFDTAWIMQDTNGITFLGSPVELPHIRAAVDYDCYTDSEELQRTISIILDEHGQDVFAREMISWSRSRKGNMTAYHNEVSITVFPAKEGGYKTVLELANGKKSWLPRKKTELEAVKHVTDNFRQICADTNRSNNPFVKWPDADDYPELEYDYPR